MRCPDCAHWSTAAGSCYCPPEIEHHILFPGTTDPCPAFRDRMEAEADVQRCLRCIWWSERGRCFAPRVAAQPGEGARCPEFVPGEYQVHARAGRRFTGGRGSRPWRQQPERI